MAKGAKAKALDFSNVKERGEVSPMHRDEGDYLGTVTAVKDIQMGETKRDAWMFIVKIGAGTYAYRCGFNDNELWKIRNLFVAAGAPVPKKRQTIDPNKVVNKKIGVTLQDSSYEKDDGTTKMSSEIAAVFPHSELNGNDGPVDMDDLADEDEYEAPEPKAKVKKDKKPKVEEAPEPAPAAKKDKKKKGAKMETLDIDEL